MKSILTVMVFASLLMSLPASAEGEGAMSAKEIDVTYGFADSNGVKIHYAEAGEGPLVIFIHGFPDYWYSWRHQMAGLKDAYRVVAIDQRGYNKSDAPEGQEAYDMRLLVSDVVSVIRHLGEEKAIVVGHDWGGVVAWNTAFYASEVVDKLVILNLPHPNGISQALKNNPDVVASTSYTKAFKELTPDHPQVFFGMPMTPETISGWVKDPEARKHYIEAFKRSDFTAMLNYYKQNYPDVEADGESGWGVAPNIAISTLMFHGLEDKALHSDGLNNTWDWIDADLTLTTIPGADHFVQQDAADYVTKTLRLWLDARRGDAGG